MMKQFIHVTPNTSIDEMTKLFFSKMNIPENVGDKFIFWYMAKKLDIYDISTLISIGMSNVTNIKVIESIPYQLLVQKENLYKLYF